jgi:hypothetical protein
MDYPTVTLKTFNGGQRDRDHPSELEDNQYSYGKDLDIREGGLFSSRRGRTKKVNSPSGTPQGTIYFSPDSATKILIHVNGGRIFKWEGSATSYTEIDPSVSLSNTSNPVGFGILNGRLLIFSGNGDNVRSWDGSSPTLTDEGNTNGDPPLVSIAASQSRKMLAAKTDTAGTEDFVYVCSVNDAQTWDRTTNNVRIPTEGNEGVTALAMYRQNLVIAMTRNSCHFIDVSASSVNSWTRETLDPKIGSVSPWITVTGEDAFFQSADGHIRTIKRTAFDKALGISQPITYWNPNLIDRIKKTKLHLTRGVWFDNYLLVAVCLDNSNYNNGVIVFDMLHQVQSPSGLIPVCVGEWTNMYVGDWAVTYFNNKHQLYYTDSRDGSVYLMFDGETDDGTAVVPQCDMKAVDWGTQRAGKTLLDIDLQILDTFGTIVLDLAKDDGVFNSNHSESVGSASAQLPFTLPVQLGSGGVPDFVPASGYGLGQSRWWQPRISHTGGKISLKQITLRAIIEPVISSGY